MNIEEYKKCIELINAVRDYDSFTTKMISSLVDKSYEANRQRLLKLRGIGAVLLVDGSKTKFVIANNARQLLAKYYEKAKAKQESSRKITSAVGKHDFDCSMVVVNKANVTGMGNSFLKQFDNLLSGVRA